MGKCVWPLILPRTYRRKRGKGVSRDELLNTRWRYGENASGPLFSSANCLTHSGARSRRGGRPLGIQGYNHATEGADAQLLMTFCLASIYRKNSLCTPWSAQSETIQFGVLSANRTTGRESGPSDSAENPQARSEERRVG